MITNLVFFAFITGFLSGGVIIAAIFWAKNMGLQMNWWKWLLSAIWYFMLLLLLFAAFTFIGEGEPAAGWRTVGISLFVMLVLGTGLFKLLQKGSGDTGHQSTP